MAEARTISDPAGNAKLSKGSQGGRRVRARDDAATAAAAAILAVAAGYRQPGAPKPEVPISRDGRVSPFPLFPSEVKLCLRSVI